MKKLFASLLVMVLIVIACQKETSFESGSTPSTGDIQSDVNGDCFPKTVTGTYVQGTALVGTSNQIQVQVQVTQAGSYTVYSDTVNGVYFRLTGTFTSLGPVTVALRGNGTPFTAGTFNYVINYNGQSCSVPVTFLPTGAGGAAVFTLNGTGTPTVCSNTTIAGTYVAGIATNATNKATVEVNVTTIGTYNVSTTATNGLTFSATGTFSTTGVQPLVLNATGTPATAGTTTIPVTVGTSSCSFAVPVGAPAAGTLGGGPGACTPFTPAGTYAQGVPMNNGNTVAISTTVATVGAYSITTNTQNGVTFAASGTFPGTGAQPVTLTATGTPAAAGTFTYTVTFGTSTCTFPVTFTAAPAIDYFPRTVNSNWSHEFDDDPNDSLLTKVISATHTVGANTYAIFMATDDAAAGFDTLGYFRKSGGDYFRYVNLAFYLGFDDDYFAEFVFLKDNVAAGATWSTPAFTGKLSGTTVQVRIQYKMLQKDVSVTVNSVVYPNTLVVEEKYEIFVGGVWTDATAIYGSYKDYYSRNVGWIKDEYFATGAPPADGVMELRRHVVY